jgi:hypothetical protein
MKFTAAGPDIPDQLIAAQERGDVVFICGAGVSRRVGLPDFRGLVKAVYDHIRESWDDDAFERSVMQDDGKNFGQYDRVLRSLERRLAGGRPNVARVVRSRIREAVRKELAPRAGADLSVHRALFELSRAAEGHLRLVTTNFDVLFELACAPAPPSHAGPAMPQPRTTACEGILHLHGRMANEQPRLDETDWVLNSAEFGEAYLRSGWASRYVYDLARAYTVVLIGYEAEDPPLRYILEVLEADRERYQDIRQVFAFASSTTQEMHSTLAFWRAKGVTPIHHVADDGYDNLYATILEWRRFAEDPSRWRSEQLAARMLQKPGETDAGLARECVELLRHGDAGALLESVNPDPAWLPYLVSARLFKEDGPSPGRWIGRRILDPEMAVACARWPIDRETQRTLTHYTVHKLGAAPSEMRRAWRMILRANEPAADPFACHYVEAQIAAGDFDYLVRRQVADLLRPRLRIHDRATFAVEPAAARLPLAGYLECGNELPVDELLDAWPTDARHESALLETLGATLASALAEASDLESERGWDTSDRSVPSVAPHGQNAHRAGFLPMIAAVSRVWSRLADSDVSAALRFFRAWGSARSTLERRLACFAAAHEAIAVEELAELVLRVDDEFFWLSGAQVEIMRALVNRWSALAEPHRRRIEERLLEGVPRRFFAESTSGGEPDDWDTVHSWSIFRRLARLHNAGCALGANAQETLRAIASQRNWKAGPGDRDDFHAWLEVGTGTGANVAIANDLPDVNLLSGVRQLERDRLDQRNLWNEVCRADPARALRGLVAHSQGGSWDYPALAEFLWVASERAHSEELMRGIVEVLSSLDERAWPDVLDSAAHWLDHTYASLKTNELASRASLWSILLAACGRVAALDSDVAKNHARSALLSLLRVLMNELSATQPRPRGGLPGDLKTRFNQVVGQQLLPGLSAHFELAHNLEYLYSIDREWTETSLIPLMESGTADASSLLCAYIRSKLHSDSLFGRLWPTISRRFSDIEPADQKSLFVRLLQMQVWTRRGRETSFALNDSEVKALLQSAPIEVRTHYVWNLRRMFDRVENPAEAAALWSSVVAPILRATWSLGVAFRDADVSGQLVDLALACGDGFGDAVRVVVDYVGPYRFWSIRHEWFGAEDPGIHCTRWPQPTVELLNAVIDPREIAPPHDLGDVLGLCVQSDASLAGNARYRRLKAIVRSMGA